MYPCLIGMSYDCDVEVCLVVIVVTGFEDDSNGKQK
jgi:hypothetical protein